MRLSVGPKLLRIREERKLSQSEMADIIGVSTSAYSRMEREETAPEITDVLRYANMLNVPIQEMLPDTLSINNNSQGQGGAVIAGNLNNYHYYFGTNETTKELEEQIKKLQEENASLRRKAE